MFSMLAFALLYIHVVVDTAVWSCSAIRPTL